MTIKCRWWKIDVGLDANALRIAMEQHPFSEQSGFGFTVDQVQNGVLAGRFVAEVVEQRRALNPYGEIESADVRSYEHTAFSFRATKSSYMMRIDSSPKSMSRFLDALKRITGINPSISLQTLPYAELVPLLRNRFSMQLKAVKMGSVAFGPKVVGKAYLVAVEGSELIDFAGLSDKAYRIDAFQGSIAGIPLRTEIATTATHGLSASGPLERQVRGAVEDWLAQRCR